MKTKPTPKTFSLLDWEECTLYINETHGIDTRDFANAHAQYGEWCAANNQVPDGSSQTQFAEYQADIKAGKLVERPYQDFWHWLLDVADIHRGGMLELDEEMGEDAEPWQKQILALYLAEFGKGPYHTDW
jgi:hypothetical protein